MSNEFRIYKPTKDGKGAASKFQLRELKNKRGDKEYSRFVLYLTSTIQTGTKNGNAQFAWNEPDKCTNVMLAENDIGEFLLVLSGRKDGLGLPDKDGKFKGLYHKHPKNPKRNAVIRFDATDRGFNLSVSTQNETNIRVFHALTFGEGAVLEILLKDYISTRYAWF